MFAAALARSPTSVAPPSPFNVLANPEKYDGQTLVDAWRGAYRTRQMPGEFSGSFTDMAKSFGFKPGPTGPQLRAPSTYRGLTLQQKDNMMAMGLSGPISALIAMVSELRGDSEESRYNQLRFSSAFDGVLLSAGAGGAGPRPTLGTPRFPESSLVIAAENTVGDGLIYLRTDTTGRLKPYFGQTTEANQLAREAAHARAFPESEFKFVTVESGIPKGSALDIAEHNAIQDFTGGVAARRSSAVSNLRDPVGPARRPTFGLSEPK